MFAYIKIIYNTKYNKIIVLLQYKIRPNGVVMTITFFVKCLLLTPTSEIG